MNDLVNEFRYLKDKLVEIYLDSGSRKVEEFMVMSGINLYAGWSLIGEKVEDAEIKESIARLKRFYGY
jgi:hypothetical protein